MRERYFSSLNLDSIERFFVISGAQSFPVSDVIDIARHIVDKWSTHRARRKPNNERFAPYFFFPGIGEEALIEVKQALANDKLLIVDGFTFLGSIMDIYSVLEPQTIHRPIAARFLAGKEQLMHILHMLQKEKFIIQMYIKDREVLPPAHRQVSIPVSSANMIKSIL